MPGMVLKAINKCRRIYHLKRHGREAVLRSKGIAPLAYNEWPRVSAVLQLFNKRENVHAILASLFAAQVEEIIVLDDGSSDGALEVLSDLLRGKNHFIIRSNDLYEVRTYSRTLDFARGQIVALLQDDDLPPLDGLWVEHALQLFERYPRLAVLGGRDGLELKLKDDPASGPAVTYRRVGLRQGRRAGPPFTFVDAVNRAPMLLRRDAIRRLGGIDNAFAPVQCDDVDLCLRAWKAGLQVGLYSADFVRDVGMGGMRLFNADFLPAQAKRNWKTIYHRYGPDIANGHIAALVAEARSSEKVGTLAC
jgi:glycosyltransferase involved in cell wall biosynthesis